MTQSDDPRLPFVIDPDALTFGWHVVFDHDTIEEAEAFVAESNKTDVDTVRRETAEHGRMLGEYQQDLRRGKRREP